VRVRVCVLGGVVRVFDTSRALRVLGELGSTGILGSVSRLGDTGLL
jgi:hypothetical protein